jgi:hypothetical protein
MPVSMGSQALLDVLMLPLDCLMLQAGSVVLPDGSRQLKPTVSTEIKDAQLGARVGLQYAVACMLCLVRAGATMHASVLQKASVRNLC